MDCCVTPRTQRAAMLNLTTHLSCKQKNPKYPRHVGPYHRKARNRNFQVDVADLRKDSEYRAYMVVYSGSTSLKSTQLYFCK